MILWRIATDTATYVAEDMSGKGAEITGGRWNKQGTAVVYSACSVALACLETVVHLNADELPLNRYLVRIDVPDDLWAARETASLNDLPLGWDASPQGMVSLSIGEKWLAEAETAILQVPSVIVPEEANALINPLHPEAKRIFATKVRKWLFDARLR